MSTTPTNSAAAPLLQLENVTAFYGDLQALFGISLRVQPGEIVTLIGANGAGKTTILRVISGMKHPEDGAVRFNGEEVSRVPAHQMVARGVSHVPEGRQVFPFLTVRENLSLGAYTPKARRGSKEAMEEQLTLFPRLAERMNQLAGTLSGGEQQMVAIARGLMARPRLLLLDEPSLGLAPLVIAEIFSALDELRAQGVTILLVEQDARLALRHADRGSVMRTGRVVLEGPAADLLADESVRTIYLGAWHQEGS
jgi:branched-chain amino acid transport system ATP-binding protein